VLFQFIQSNLKSWSGCSIYLTKIWHSSEVWNFPFQEMKICSEPWSTSILLDFSFLDLSLKIQIFTHVSELKFRIQSREKKKWVDSNYDLYLLMTIRIISWLLWKTWRQSWRWKSKKVSIHNWNWRMMRWVLESKDECLDLLYSHLFCFDTEHTKSWRVIGTNWIRFWLIWRIFSIKTNHFLEKERKSWTIPSYKPLYNAQNKNKLIKVWSDYARRPNRDDQIIPWRRSCNFSSSDLKICICFDVSTDCLR